MVTVSVIIVNYRTYNLTVAAINAVHRVLKGYSYELIVIDNHSNDESYDRLLALTDANTHIYKTTKNGGFGYGNNYGVCRSSGKYLFFLNSDTILYDHVLIDMIEYMKSHTEIGVMSCLMENGDGAPLVISHRFETLKTLFLQTIIKPIVPQKIQDRRAKINHLSYSGRVTDCDWVSGAAMLMPRKVFDLVGGWNELFFMYMEDEELCFRIHKSGYKVVVYPRLGLRHLIGKSGGSSFVAYEKYKSSKLYFRMVKAGPIFLINFLIYLQAWGYMKKIGYRTKINVIKRLIKV